MYAEHLDKNIKAFLNLSVVGFDISVVSNKPTTIVFHLKV